MTLRGGYMATCLLLTLAPAPASAADAEPGYRQQPFELDHAGDRIVPIDLDGDGLIDLLTADGSRLQIYFQRGANDDGEVGFDFSKPDAVLDLPGNAVGWDIDDQDGDVASGAARRILALVDGTRLLAWPIRERAFAEPETLLTDLPGNLPHGAYPMHFVRDVDGRHGNDVIVPSAGELHLYLRQADGSYGPGLSIASQVHIQDRVDAGDDLTNSVGQRVHIPQLRIRDVNGNGRPDLVSRTDEQLEVFLAQDDGAYRHAPSYSLDIAAIEARVGTVDLDNIDFSNLTGLLAHTYQVIHQDVDGDGIEDLLVREGGRITLYAGTPDGMDLASPRQVLRSSGNVLGIMLRDENDNGLDDLWLMRVQTVSIGNIFLWLVVSGSVDIEVFIYHNDGTRFGSRPSRRLTVTVQFPSVLRATGMFSNIARNVENAPVVRTAAAHVGGDRQRKDVLVLTGAGVDVYLDAHTEDDRDNEFFDLFDYRRDRDRYVIDLGRMLETIDVPGSEDWQSVRDRSADFTLALQPPPHEREPAEAERAAPVIDTDTADLVALDLNADGVGDVIVLLEREASTVSGVLLLSQ